MEKDTQTTAESVGQKTQTSANIAKTASYAGIEKTENAEGKPTEEGEATTGRVTRKGVLNAQKAFIAPYEKAYPEEKAFHVTSDKQVFLEKDRGLAILHQNSLKNGEKVQTIKVK